MDDLKVTAIQFDIIWEDKRANFTKLEVHFLSKISIGDSDLIVLPEMFATGFTMQPDKFWEDENGPTFQWLKKWSNKLNTCIGGGLITKTDNHDYQNTFLVVSPNGDMQQYHKRHLFRMGAENQHYASGQLPKILELNTWRINLQICYDLRFPVFTRNRIVENRPLYDAIIYIANWPSIRAYAWTNLLQARAIENQAYVIGVNRVGLDDNKIIHSGDSASIDCSGKYVQTPILHIESVFTTILSADSLLKSRKYFPVLHDSGSFKLTDN